MPSRDVGGERALPILENGGGQRRTDRHDVPPIGPEVDPHRDERGSRSPREHERRPGRSRRPAEELRKNGRTRHVLIHEKTHDMARVQRTHDAAQTAAAHVNADPRASAPRVQHAIRAGVEDPPGDDVDRIAARGERRPEHLPVTQMGRERHDAAAPAKSRLQVLQTVETNERIDAIELTRKWAKQIDKVPSCRAKHFVRDARALGDGKLLAERDLQVREGASKGGPVHDAADVADPTQNRARRPARQSARDELEAPDREMEEEALGLPEPTSHRTPPVHGI